MANTDGPRGFTPVTSLGGCVRSRLYTITTTDSNNIFVGDFVVREAAGTVARATAGAGNRLLGAVRATYDSNMVPTSYRAASVAGYALVADEPNQEFLAQDDGDTTQLALADRGANVNIVTTHAGSTVNYRSGMEIDSSSAGTTTTQQLRLIDIHDVQGNAVGANCKWIVRINYGQDVPGVVGAAI